MNKTLNLFEVAQISQSYVKKNPADSVSTDGEKDVMMRTPVE